MFAAAVDGVDLAHGLFGRHDRGVPRAAGDHARHLVLAQPEVQRLTRGFAFAVEFYSPEGGEGG